MKSSWLAKLITRLEFQEKFVRDVPTYMMARCGYDRQYLTALLGDQTGLAKIHMNNLGQESLPGGRVADPVHFRPDPTNQNFENWIRILLALTKNQFKHFNFFHSKHISSDI